MWIFSRIKNALSSKENNTLDDLGNPIQLLNEKISDMEENLNKAQIYAAPVLGNVREIKSNIKNAEEEIESYDKEIKLALQKGNEDLAKKTLEKKLQKDKEVATLEKNLVNAEEYLERLKDNLHNLKEEIYKIRSYRDEAVARYNNAKIAERVNTVIADIKTKKGDISLDDIERKVAKVESQAIGMNDLEDIKKNDI